MKRKYIYSVLILCMMLFITACGAEFPQISEEQEKQIAEYAAFSLLKYDANSRSRLVPREVVLEADQRAIERAKRKEQEALNNKKDNKEDEDVTIEEPVVIEQPEVVIKLEEFLDLPQGLIADYVGYDIVDSYTDDNGLFTIDAMPNKKLMIANIKITNSSNGNINVNLLNKNISAVATFVDGNKKAALTSMLMDDMTTFIGDIAGNGEQKLVLVFEIEENQAINGNVNNIYLKIDSNKYTIQW